MCTICGEPRGHPRCPCCQETEAPPETFPCKNCGEEYPEEEAIPYNSSYYCRECYELQKEDDEEAAITKQALQASAIYQTLKLFI